MDHPIIFFDGICLLCNGYVDFLIKRDKKKNLRFSPLQGLTIQQTAAKKFSGQNTIVLLKEGKIYTESSAVLEGTALLGGFWKALKIFLIVPPFIRNCVYRFIANRRYRWFGKLESCRLPTAQEKELFLE